MGGTNVMFLLTCRTNVTVAECQLGQMLVGQIVGPPYSRSTDGIHWIPICGSLGRIMCFNPESMAMDSSENT
jgi:hypothetical protein